MTKGKTYPAHLARTEEGNKEIMRAIVEMFNDIYEEMDYIEKTIPNLSDRVGVVREKMRRIDEYRNNLKIIGVKL